MPKNSRLQDVFGVFILGAMVFALTPSVLQAAEPALPSHASHNAVDAVSRSRYTPPHREAARHILIKLDANADLPRLRARARTHGLDKLDRVYGSDWYTLSLPANANPRATCAIARHLPGVVMSTTDPIIALDVIPPGDPLYVDDDDPSTKSCDPVTENCDPLQLIDQWGLFKVEAEGAWNVTTGSNGVVIAVIDSGMDLDHDDLIDNVWTNPADPVNGIDDDGNGFIDDVHGADFVGDNLGNPLTDNVASQDANPDIPMGGTWVNDAFAYPYGIRFDGDPAVGDAVDNNFDFFADLGVFHGTFVAAIVAAMTDNTNPATGQPEGMAGACWNCKIMPVRMVNAEGNGYGSDAAAAIYYATDMGADIINLSWGFDLDNLDPAGMAEVAVITDAINHAVANGVIVVASAGNSGAPALRFPAAMANTIAVGASNWLDQRSGFSTIAGFGEVPDNGFDDDGNGRVDDALDVVAPGEYIWSGYVYSAFESLQAQFLGDPSLEPGTDAYANSNGTSFSAPLVAGYIGLLKSQFPNATPAEIRDAVRNYAIDLLDPEGVGDNLPGYDAFSGFGRLRMHIPASLSDPAPPPPPPPPSPVIALTVDAVDAGQYGYNYGTSEHGTRLVATFQGDGVTAYQLQVTGYDIDSAGEVAVYLNGTAIGDLTAGPENGLNAGDVFTLDTALLLNGQNTLEFRQRTAGFTWGVTSIGVLTPPPPPPVIALTVDAVDAGQYGYNYGTSEHAARLFATFQGDGVTAYQLQVTGYDIDGPKETSIHLNGAQIGYLSQGPDNGLNGGDVISLDPALLVAGENTLEFREQVAGWTWGVTSIGVLTPPPPPPVIALTVDAVDAGQYGYNYGTSEHEARLFATFQGDGVTAYQLQVTGYDIDGPKETSIHLNGAQIGYLSESPDNGLNGGDVISLDPALLVAGENTLEFREQVAGWTWGVTSIGVLTPPPPPPVIALTVDAVDAGQYGYNYGSSEHEARLFATFQGDGVTAYQLQVTGYDIDGPKETSIHLNGVQIGYLSEGPDNGLNGGDAISLDPALLVAGENTLEFREQVAGWTWGVTNLAVVTAAPVIALTVDAVDTGQYGYNYGSSEHETQLFATFQGDRVTAYQLQVTGYDIDLVDEISVHLNGVQIGYLSTGPDNGLNAGDVISLDPALLVAGKNSLEFRQRVAGWKWGVTSLAVVVQPVVALTVGVFDTGQYGYNYGSSEHETQLFATFQGDGVTAYQLQVTGYDIDLADEISVHLNGVQIGYLSTGPNNGLNAGDVISLDPALLVAGKNLVEFRQRVAGWKWGITNLAVVAPPVVALTVGVFDTGQYGYNYGTSEHETQLFATFQGDGVTAYQLQVTGYDIDLVDEISVYLNGVQIGYLSTGPDNGLNAGDVISLDPALLVAGENTLEFRQQVAGWTWGVTNLGVFDL